MLTPLSKILIGVGVVGLIVGGLMYLNSNPSVASKIAPGLANESASKAAPLPERKQGEEDVIVAVVNTWGGFAGGISYNGGKDASTNSRYYKQFGQRVQFEISDDFFASRDMLKNGNVDVLCFATVGEFSIEAAGLAEFGVKVVAQIDKSFGGDALVVRAGINSVNDLVGKNIALAPASPSHGLLVNLLRVSGLTQSDVTIREVKDGLDAASVFKAEQVDAAFVWSPDDADCVAKVSGAKVLFNTKKAPDIIWDCMLVRESTIETKREALKNFIAGWLEGNALLNTNKAYRQEAVKIMSTVYNIPDDGFWSNLEIAKFVTLGDNKNFFGLNSSYKGVTGEELYTRMGNEYKTIRLNSGEPLMSGVAPAWRTVSDPSLIRELLSDSRLNTPKQLAEGETKFEKPTLEIAEAPAVTSTQITVEFEFGSAKLTDTAKRIIRRDFGSIARGFTGVYIRLEGNTDNIGSRQTNVALSLRRASAVKDYLVSEYGWDPNRFIVRGNGPDSPVSTNDTDEGRAKNRRTDFEFVRQ